MGLEFGEKLHYDQGRDTGTGRVKFDSASAWGMVEGRRVGILRV